MDWANAPKLTVTVAFPPEWGNSPQSGEGRCGDTRKGYEFGVEFIPLSGYGFEKWLAFRTTDYADLDKTKSASEVEDLALNGDGVTIVESISETGAKTAMVTINTLDPVTLVPWCGNRPRLSQQTNPPLNSIQVPFPYDQIVNIWFTMPVKASTLIWDNIHIIGLYTSGNNRGQPFNGNGNLAEFFKLEIPSGFNNRLNLIPKQETAQELALLSISVIIGPGIESENGIAMAQAQTISYQTDTREAQKVYRAVNMSASVNAASGYFNDIDWGNPDKDRRLKQTDKNTVYIRFSVDAPSGDDIPPTPNKIRIVEHKVFDLGGFPASGTREKEYDFPGTGIALSGGVFTITHTLQTLSSGIIQLLILPWYQGTPTVAIMPDNEAVSEGLYVTVVLDNAAPDVSDMMTTLSTPSSGGGDAVYVYGTGTPLTLTIVNLASITDNGGDGGIPASRAYSLPWTMDDPKDLKWQVQITRTDGLAGHSITAGPLNVYNGETLNNSYTWVNLSGLIESIIYRIDVQFEDRLGNTRLVDTGKRVMYSTATKRSVSKLKAECNADGNQITVSWDEPLKEDNVTPDYLYPELVIYRYRTSASGDIFDSEILRYDFDKSPSEFYNLSVSTIEKDRVRDGIAVSGVYGYRIIVITHNTAGPETSGPIWIYNIPDMKTAEWYMEIDGKTYMPVARITENTGQLTVNYGSNTVLTRDITLSRHTPIYFTANFYGNGHTITMNNGFSAGFTNVGIFSEASNALICDLTVVYKDTTFIGNISQTYVGGIAGLVTGNTEIRNCIVRGFTVNDTLTVTAKAKTMLGGITGYIQGTACIQNCHAALNVMLSSNDNNDIRVGGVVGCSNGIKGRILFTDISSVAVVRMNKTDGATNSCFCGGIAGYIENTNLRRCVFRGKIDIPVTFNANSFDYNEFSYIGGLVGIYKTGIMDYCSVTGDIIVNSSGTLQVCLGGVVGLITGDNDYNGNISIVVITNTNYSDGTIQLIDSSDVMGTASYYHRVGGFFGKLSNDGIVENCHSRATSVTVQVNKSTYCIYVGGFAGEIDGSVFQCDSTSPVIVPASNAGTGQVSVGGFCGNITSTSDDSSKIENCFAKGSVTVYCSSNGYGFANNIGGFAGAVINNSTTNVISRCYATGDIFAVNHADVAGALFGFRVGGLVGLAQGTDISECYATGNVTARKGSCGNMPVVAGGLVGFLGFTYPNDAQKSSIVDCYATGNVTADNPNADSAPVYAGGLVGYMQVAYTASPLTGIVTRSFASGTVSAKSASDGIESFSWGASAYAGGVVGYKASGNLQRCVAAGHPSQQVSVSAQGGQNRYVGRIYGQSAGTAPANNYANAAIFTGKGTGNGTAAGGYYTNPTLAVVTSIDATSADGATVTNSQLSGSSFWTGAPLSFSNFATDPINGKWDFGPVAQGYPKLKNVGGQ